MPVSPGKLLFALRAVQNDGAAFIACALADDLRSSVAAEAATAVFRKLPECEGQIRQEAEQLMLSSGTDRYPAITRLRDQFIDAVRHYADSIGGLDQWMPNEVSVQRYRAGALGITPHMDRKRYRYLIAVFTVAGSATFTVCKNRAGDACATWPAGPGSLALLRGPGLGGIEDGRPLHAVTGPVTGQRISIGFRMAIPPNPAMKQ